MIHLAIHRPNQFLVLLEVNAFYCTEIVMTKIKLIVFIMIITIPIIENIINQIHYLICDVITQSHNWLDVTFIWYENIVPKTIPIPIKELHGVFRVGLTGKLDQSCYLLEKQLDSHLWDWYFCNINNLFITTTLITTTSLLKNGNQRCMPSLLNPHSPLQPDLLKHKSYPWLLFFFHYLQNLSIMLSVNEYMSLCWDITLCCICTA